MYVKIDENNNATRYTLGQLRRDNPSISFPSVIPQTTLQEYSVYPLVDTAQPEYNSLTHQIEEYLEDSGNGHWERKWNIIPRADSTVKAQLASRIANQRYEKESSGIIWTDANGDTWFLDTTTESQSRITGAKTAVNAGIRTDGSVWKCAQIVNGDQVLAFRPTSNAEISEWAQLIHDLVQKCFTAEANAYAKINAGDFTVTFEHEFNLL